MKNKKRYYNVDDIVLSILKISNERIKDKDLFNKQIGYINGAIEILTQKESINYDKDEQLAKVGRLENVIDSICKEYPDRIKERCIKLDDALFNLDVSLQENNASNTINRDDYNSCFNLWKQNIFNRAFPFRAILNNIKKDIENVSLKFAYARSWDLSDEFKMSRNTLKTNLAHIQNQCISEVQQKLNNNKNGELNEQQLNNIGEVFKVLAEYKKSADQDLSEINKHIENYDKILELLGTYIYKPSSSKLKNMSNELEENCSEFENRYNRTIGTYEKFDYENSENLKNITESAKSSRNIEVNRYNTMKEKFEEEITKINNDQTNDHDKTYCNNILDALINTRNANNKSMYELETGAVEFLVDIVDVENNLVTNARSVKNNTLDTKPKKIIKDGEIVIETSVQGTNGKIVI